jgi:predicted AAA+ superfamily ATPase
MIIIYYIDLVNTPEYDSLVAILRSGMHPWTAELQMRCTVLVTGVRGVGKRTMIVNATDQLGVHLLEVIIAIDKIVYYNNSSYYLMY